MFNESTTSTTLLNPAAPPVPLDIFGDELDTHESNALDFGQVALSRQAPVTGCKVLILSGSQDRIVPDSMVLENAKMWGVEPVWVQGQGHNLGDPGWEESVMQPLMGFLEGLE